MVSWKGKIENSAETTLAEYGGKTIDNILDYFSNVDLSNAGLDTDGIGRIATYTYFNNNTLNVYDSAGDHYIKFQLPDYTENHTLTFPSEATLSTTDEFVFKDAPQIIRFKTIDLQENTILNLPSTSGIVETGTFTGDGNQSTYSFPHNTVPIPHFVHVQAASDDAIGDFKVTFDATNITVTYNSITNTGTGNISLSWFVGFEGTRVLAGGLPAGGTTTKNGGSTTVTIAHGMTPTPQTFYVFPTTADARGNYTLTIDSTNITITYPLAPPTGTGNLGYVWGAGYVNQAQGFTADSATTLTNKTIGDTLAFDLQDTTPTAPVDADDSLLFTDDIDANNNGLFIWLKKAGVATKVQIA